MLSDTCLFGGQENSLAHFCTKAIFGPHLILLSGSIYSYDTKN